MSNYSSVSSDSASIHELPADQRQQSKALFGLRVTKAEEEEGLDIGEHGQVAYTGFANTGYGA